MTVLEIKSIASPDVDIESWRPSDSADVYVLIELEIGEKGVPGADIFSAVVATPEALRKRDTDRFLLADRATFVVAVYDWVALAAHLRSLLERCNRETWTESVQCLQRYFLWEYEDYQHEQ